MIYKYEIYQKSHCEYPDFETEGTMMAKSKKEAISKLMKNCSVNEEDIYIKEQKNMKNKKLDEQIRKDLEEMSGIWRRSDCYGIRPENNPHIQGFKENYEIKMWKRFTKIFFWAWVITYIWAISFAVYTTYLFLKY